MTPTCFGAVGVFVFKRSASGRRLGAFFYEVEAMAQRSKAGRPVEELKELLERARKLCEELGEGISEPLARVAELQQRLTDERFHLAVLGQFKRGKSTLLNALLGEPLLPTGVVPLTSIPTFLRAGKTRAVRIFFHDARQAIYSDLALERASDILARHVTEKENPWNRLGVERVEVDHPSSLLIAGVVLIDTPGIGSTLRHNTEATLHFVTQCDAALFVVSADPPITEVEREFLKAVQGKVAKLCFVMNKIDYLTQSELAEAASFFKTVLKDLGFREHGTIFNVSAKQGIEATVKEDPLQWSESGLERLQSYLLEFLSREKSRTLQMALARKAADVITDTAMNVELQRRSLELSQQEWEKRIESFDVKVKEIEKDKIKVGDLLAGDKKRTVQLLEDRAYALRQDARRHLLQTARVALQDDSASPPVGRQAKARIAEEIPAYFAEKLALFFNEMSRALQEVLGPYHERLDAMVGALRATAAELFEIPYHSSESNERLQDVHKPCWVTQNWNTLISAVPEGFVDRFLPGELRKQRLKKRLAEEVESLVTQNVENLRWATLRNVDEAFRGFSSTLEERWKATAEATRAAMSAARLRHKQDEKATAPEIARLGKKAGELAELKTQFSQFAESL
jgi:GTPase Era involved in 16S rRNA processing